MYLVPSIVSTCHSSHHSILHAKLIFSQVLNIVLHQMQYLDPGNTQMRLPSLYHGPNFMTHHHSYASVQSSSLATPASAAAAPAASTSVPNNFREFQTEAANSQLKGTIFLLEQFFHSHSKLQTIKHFFKEFTLVGNALLRQNSGTSTSSQVSVGGSHGIIRQKTNMAGTGNVIRDVGFLPDELYGDTVPQGTSPSVTSCRQELHPLGISLFLSPHKILLLSYCYTSTLFALILTII
jgi:hypothetical protein